MMHVANIALVGRLTSAVILAVFFTSTLTYADSSKPKTSPPKSEAAGFTANEILERADAIRNPSESFRMLVEVKTDEDMSKFEVFTKGKDKTLIKTLAPAKDIGRNLLMLEENMWAYIPNLKRAVRIGLNQKLTGQAANGDISRMRWSGDYTPAIEKAESDVWVLFLTATRKGLTYEKIRIWIAKDTFRPQKAEYLTLAGKPLKTAAFEGYREIAGGIRPTQIVIADAMRKDQVSTIFIRELEKKDFPDTLFQQTNLN